MVTSLKTLASPTTDTGADRWFGENQNYLVKHVKRTPVASIIVSTEGSNYVVQKTDGTELYNDTNAETAITTALAQKGRIHVKEGSYVLPSNFAGWTVDTNTNLTGNFAANNGTYLIIPNGFSGSVFTMDSTSSTISRSTIEGFKMAEVGTPQRLWKGLNLNSVSNGIFSNFFGRMEMYDAGVGIYQTNTDTTGWLNGNTFKDIWIFNPNIGLQWNQAGTAVSNGQQYNVYYNIEVQSGTNTTSGFKDISGTGNSFFGCICWDTPVASSSANVTAYASKNRIVGGAMTQTNWTDSSGTTFINDYAQFKPNDNIEMGSFAVRTTNLEMKELDSNRMQITARSSSANRGLYLGTTGIYTTKFNNISSLKVIETDNDAVVARLGFMGATPVARQSVSGSRGGNAALASLLSGLANLGLITDSTTA